MKTDLKEKQLFIYNHKDTFPAKTMLEQVIKNHKILKEDVIYYHCNKSDKSFDLDTLLNQLISPKLSVADDLSPQLLVVWNYEHGLNEKKILEILKLLNNSNNIVFLISSENEKKGAKQQISDQIKHHNKVNFFSSPYLDYRKVNQRIEHFFKEHKLKATPHLIEHLCKHFQKKINAVEDAESDPVKTDLEKIQLSVKPQQSLTIEQVVAVIDELREERSEFAIVDAFFKKDIRLTLTNLLIFLQNSGNLISLVQRLVFETTQLIQIKEELTENHHFDDIFKNLKVYFSFQKTKLKQAHSMFLFSELIALLEDFIAIEKTLKSENLVNSNVTKNKVNLKAKLALEKTILLRLRH